METQATKKQIPGYYTINLDALAEAFALQAMTYKDLAKSAGVSIDTAKHYFSPSRRKNRKKKYVKPHPSIYRIAKALGFEPKDILMTVTTD